MDIDEKIKEEQLKYYQRENELREEAKQQHAEIVESNKNLVKAVGIVIIVTLCIPFIGIAFELAKALIYELLK